MLNREHLRYHRVRGVFRPDFIDIRQNVYCELASELLSLYADAARNGMTRGAVEELTEAAQRGSAVPKVASGLNKLLMDRAEFSPAAELDYPARRAELFAASGKALALAQGDEARYRELLNENFKTFLDGDIYGDLPDFEKLLHFDPLTPEELLQRYNLALAQGLLMYAQEVRIQVQCPEAQELRRMLKYLKFFRLLAELKMPEPGKLSMTVSGPLSLFGPTRKYALQLAEFLPAVVRLPHYTVEAELKLPQASGTLKLDDSMPLVSHYRNFSAYLPEEIRMYHRLFAATKSHWKIVGSTPFLRGRGDTVVFPDLSFQNDSGMLCHLELFHRWHASQLRPRLELLEGTPTLPLLLGIDRALAPTDEAWQALLDEFPHAANHCWRFRDFPGVETTLRKLDGFAEERTSLIADS